MQLFSGALLASAAEWVTEVQMPLVKSITTHHQKHGAAALVIAVHMTVER